MFNQELLQRDIETLQESIKLSWYELSRTVETEERIRIRKQLSYYIDELKILINQIL